MYLHVIIPAGFFHRNGLSRIMCHRLKLRYIWRTFMNVTIRKKKKLKILSEYLPKIRACAYCAQVKTVLHGSAILFSADVDR